MIKNHKQIRILPPLFEDIITNILQFEKPIAFSVIYDQNGDMKLHFAAEETPVIERLEELRRAYLKEGVYFDHEWSTDGRELWWYLDDTLHYISVSTDKQTPPSGIQYLD